MISVLFLAFLFGYQTVFEYKKYFHETLYETFYANFCNHNSAKSRRVTSYTLIDSELNGHSFLVESQVLFSSLLRRFKYNKKDKNIIIKKKKQAVNHLWRLVIDIDMGSNISLNDRLSRRRTFVARFCG